MKNQGMESSHGMNSNKTLNMMVQRHREKKHWTTSHLYHIPVANQLQTSLINFKITWLNWIPYHQPIGMMLERKDNCYLTSKQQKVWYILSKSAEIKWI